MYDYPRHPPLIFVMGVLCMYIYSVMSNCMYVYLGEITGNNRVPYSKLDQLGVTVEGLPNGIVFKHPSSYGRRQLQLIIETKDNIKFNGMQILLHALHTYYHVGYVFSYI